MGSMKMEDLLTFVEVVAPYVLTDEVSTGAQRGHRIGLKGRAGKSGQAYPVA